MYETPGTKDRYVETKLKDGRKILSSSKHIHGDDFFSMKKDHSLTMPEELTASKRPKERNREERYYKGDEGVARDNPDYQRENWDNRGHREKDKDACCTMI